MELNETFVNYYDVLGIKSDSAIGNVKKSYKKLALKFHPDVNKDQNANSQFKLILKAYNTLKNPETKKEYDVELKKNNSFIRKLNFKYGYKKFTEKKDAIFNKIKLFFNHTSEEEINNNLKVDDILSGNIPKDVLKMNCTDLGERLLYSDNYFVRIHSAIALGIKGEKSGLFYLEKKLYDEELDVRRAVVWALGNLKMKKSIQILKKMFYDNDSILRLNILKSLEYITGGKGFVFDKILGICLQSKIDELRLCALEVAVKNKKSQKFDSLVDIFEKIKNVNDNRILSYNGG